MPNYTFLSLKHGAKMSSLVDFVFHKLRPIFFSSDAENAHEMMLSSVEMISKFPGVIPFLRWQFREESPVLNTNLFGIKVNNPIGLAAGFDKDGRIYPSLFALGFGFVEIGTVTPKKQCSHDRAMSMGAELHTLGKQRQKQLKEEALKKKKAVENKKLKSELEKLKAEKQELQQEKNKLAEAKNKQKIDENDCKEGSIIGGVLGAGLTMSSTKGKDRWWAVPLGATAGALVGCQVDGG